MALMTEKREQPHGMKVIHVQAFVPEMRRAVMTGQLDGTVVKDRVDACGLDTWLHRPVRCRSSPSSRRPRPNSNN